MVILFYPLDFATNNGKLISNRNHAETKLGGISHEVVLSRRPKEKKRYTGISSTRWVHYTRWWWLYMATGRNDAKGVRQPPLASEG